MDGAMPRKKREVIRGYLIDSPSILPGDAFFARKGQSEPAIISATFTAHLQG